MMIPGALSVRRSASSFIRQPLTTWDGYNQANVNGTNEATNCGMINFFVESTKSNPNYRYDRIDNHKNACDSLASGLNYPAELFISAAYPNAMPPEDQTRSYTFCFDFIKALCGENLIPISRQALNQEQSGVALLTFGTTIILTFALISIIVACTTSFFKSKSPLSKIKDNEQFPLILATAKALGCIPYDEFKISNVILIFTQAVNDLEHIESNKHEQTIAAITALLNEPQEKEDDTLDISSSSSSPSIN
ncbi:MAG: hypothetical protein ACYC0J_02900 [Gammaproteobacteria bacterium]